MLSVNQFSPFAGHRIRWPRDLDLWPSVSVFRMWRFVWSWMKLQEMECIFHTLQKWCIFLVFSIPCNFHSLHFQRPFHVLHIYTKLYICVWSPYRTLHLLCTTFCSKFEHYSIRSWLISLNVIHKRQQWSGLVTTTFHLDFLTESFSGGALLYGQSTNTNFDDSMTIHSLVMALFMPGLCEARDLDLLLQDVYRLWHSMSLLREQNEYCSYNHAVKQRPHEAY